MICVIIVEDPQRKITNDAENKKTHIIESAAYLLKSLSEKSAFFNPIIRKIKVIERKIIKETSSQIAETKT